MHQKLESEDYTQEQSYACAYREHNALVPYHLVLDFNGADDESSWQKQLLQITAARRGFMRWA